MKQTILQALHEAAAEVQAAHQPAAASPAAVQAEIERLRGELAERDQRAAAAKRAEVDRLMACTPLGQAALARRPAGA